MNTVDTVFDAARRLQHAGTPYALVSVIKALAPASARPGDKAVVTADGEFHGWVGGGCSQPAVMRTVRQALADGRARVMRIAPTRDGHEKDLGDVLEYGMACHSGGTLELFVDPVLPPARLVVIGASPVAVSLTQLAPRVGFAVTLVARGANATGYPDAHEVVASDDVDAVLPGVSAGAWVVVATQGRRDLPGLRLALALKARQVSFVASRRKAQVLKDSLVAAGASPAAVAAIIAPAGYPMAAVTPEEIALSVLAAVVSDRRTSMPAGAGARNDTPGEDSPADMTPAAPPATSGCRDSEPVARSACCGGDGDAPADGESPSASARSTPVGAGTAGGTV